jgi:CRISPR-associated protein Cas6
VSAEIVDLVFALRGQAIALDYADKLLQGLVARLPWLVDEQAVGVHPLAGVSPGDRELYLTKRTKLALRLPRARVDAARALSGGQFDLDGVVEVGNASLRLLAPVKTLYSSFVAVGTTEEGAFLSVCTAELARAGIAAQLVCGRARVGRARDGDWQGHSLMLYGLANEDSLRIQRQGLGGERKRGCGVFVPHKSIAAVGE